LARRRKLIWTTALVGAGILVGVACVVSAATLARDYVTEVNGRLSGIRELSFIEGTQGDGGISPVCGCEKPPLDSWRGVTFAAHGVRLDRRGGRPWTRWSFSAAEPDTVRPLGELQHLEVLAVRIEPNGAFDPHWLLSKRLARHGRILETAVFRGHAFALYDHHDLRLAMLGSVPVGAWIPFPGSTVKLASERSEFLAENLNARLVERYPGSVGVQSRPGHKGLWASQPQYYPIGDFLGPNLVIWTEDPKAQIPGTRLDSPTNQGVVTAILIGDSNFSTRVSAAPMSAADVVESALYGKARPTAGRETLYSQDDPGGTLTLTVERPLDERGYQKLKRRVRAHQRTWVPIEYPPEGTESDSSILIPLEHSPGEAESSARHLSLPATVAAPPAAGQLGREEERYPPLPRYSGLNIFGPLQKVSFQGVHGDLTIADKTIDMGGSADLELGDVDSFRDNGGHQLISAPLATSGQSADLQFKAAGTATVNGVSETTVSSYLEPRLAGFGTVLTVVGGVIGIIASLRHFRRREPPLPEP
jgi:hypothetical protein